MPLEAWCLGRTALPPVAPPRDATEDLSEPTVPNDREWSQRSYSRTAGLLIKSNGAELDGVLPTNTPHCFGARAKSWGGAASSCGSTGNRTKAAKSIFSLDRSMLARLFFLLVGLSAFPLPKVTSNFDWVSDSVECYLNIFWNNRLMNSRITPDLAAMTRISFFEHAAVYVSDWHGGIWFSPGSAHVRCRSRKSAIYPQCAVGSCSMLMNSQSVLMVPLECQFRNGDLIWLSIRHAAFVLFWNLTPEPRKKKRASTSTASIAVHELTSSALLRPRTRIESLEESTEFSEKWYIHPYLSHHYQLLSHHRIITNYYHISHWNVPGGAREENSDLVDKEVCSFYSQLPIIRDPVTRKHPKTQNSERNSASSR